MTPEEVGERLAGLVGGEAGVSGGGSWARGTVDVPPGKWVDALRAARDRLRLDFFDWLSAVDELDDGFRIVAHVWSVKDRYGVLVRTLVPREAPVLGTAVAVYPGASWHERETYEMFGVSFDGHPDLKPLLLPPEFEGHPLRKEFILATRVAKSWPGAKEPGEPGPSGRERQGEHTTTRRAPMRPPGVPEPGTWGPASGEAPAAPAARPERPARPDRPARPAGTDRPARPAGTDRPARPDRPAAAERPARPAGPAGEPGGTDGGEA